MTSQYPYKQFIRRVANSLLANYFKSKDIDFDKLKNIEVDIVFQAFPILFVQKLTTIKVFSHSEHCH